MSEFPLNFPGNPPCSALYFRVSMNGNRIPKELAAMQNVCQALSSRESPPPRETDLCEIAAEAWELAKKRYAILDGLLHMTHRTRADVRRAAEQLRGGLTWTYELLARLRSDARLTSLISRQRGRCTGTVKLGPIREEIVRTAIDEIYLTRQQPRVSTLVLEIRQRCFAPALP